MTELDPKFDEQFAESMNAFCLSAAMQHNQLAAEGYGFSIPVRPGAVFGIEVVEDGVNEDLATTVDGSYVHVGIFDPDQNKFLPNDSIVTEAGLAPFQDYGRAKRKAANARRQTYNFEHPALKAMRGKHRQALLTEGLIYSLADGYNKDHRYPNVVRNILVDEASLFHLALMQSPGYDRTDVVVSITNSLERQTDGRLLRMQKGRYVYLAQLEHTSSNSHSPISDRISDEHYHEHIAPLTEEMIELCAQNPSFDAEHIAFRLAAD